MSGSLESFYVQVEALLLDKMRDRLSLQLTLAIKSFWDNEVHE